MAEGNPIGIEEMKKIFQSGQVNLNQGDIAMRIGQTTTIDEGKINSLLSELSKVKELKRKYASDREEIERILAATNSNAFYNNETAKAARRRLEEVEQDALKVSSEIDNLQGMLSVIREYNEQVKKIKAGQKYQLLCAVAEKINVEAENCRTTYQYRQETREVSNYGARVLSSSRDELTGEFVESKQKTDANGRITYMNTTHYVAYINYWGVIKSGRGNGSSILDPRTWFDDSTSELEEKIKKVERKLGIPLMPY